jgi:D-alanine-D-alanine ligase-like ATP-grasp enzyme
VPKAFEVRVTMIGDRCFGLRIDSQVDERTRFDWRKHQDPATIPYMAWDIPDSVRKMCAEMLTRLGLVYGAFDFIVVPDGTYTFLEINPHGQWVWVEEFSGQPLAEAFVDLLESGRT